MAYDERALRGVGGWLGFFILTLGVFSPLGGIVSLIGMHAELTDPSLAGALWWSTATGVVAIAAFIWMAILLYRRHEPQTVNVVRIGLWVAGPILMLVDVAVIAALTGNAIGDVLAMVLIDLGRAMIYATIWTLYLSFSRRVANTYTEGDPFAESAVFG